MCEWQLAHCVGPLYKWYLSQICLNLSVAFLPLPLPEFMDVEGLGVPRTEEESPEEYQLRCALTI